MRNLQPIDKSLPSSERVRLAKARINHGYPKSIVMTGVELAARHVEEMEIEFDLAAMAEDAQTRWREQGEYDQMNQQDRWDGGGL